ncbi:DUF5677 domain-containing protein [Spirosoma foliorum]|uniref:Uncharacterized protein n=1 Tax=Spirosoma foliorum TaxID=2710596 RepID=A0A7G5GY21_9BACT|nr:DUF5677 domain-containing protein [Spirosoma foliorum]QMW03763.1 hypothetical protein H3H32_02060 [Spirosoma foliorum]
MKNYNTPDLEVFPQYHDEVVQKNLDACSSAVSQLIAVGTHLLRWELEDEPKSEDERGVVGVFFKRILDLLDSTALLLKVGSIDPCINQLRALLEITLAFEYLLQADTQKRCLCYLLTDLDKDLAFYESLVGDDFGKNIPDLDERIKHFKEVIDNSIFDPIRSEYILKAFKPDGTRKKVDLKWYNLFTRMNSLKYLADFLKKDKYYKIVYSYASNVTHGTGLTGRNLSMEDGQISLEQLRNPHDAEEIAKIIIDLGKQAYKAIIKRRSTEQWQEYVWAMQLYKKQNKKYAMPYLYISPSSRI